MCDNSVDAAIERRRDLALEPGMEGAGPGGSGERQDEQECLCLG
jgi:hypothetical protein